MIGMPTPQVDPSPSSSRTCTGFPVTAGDADPAADGPAEDDGPPCHAPSDDDDDDPSQAASRARVTPSTTAPEPDRHARENLMPVTMPRSGRDRHPGVRPANTNYLPANTY
ncbi:hypothetical protein Ate02nite_55820 [Paractinoplanes tereljensis]|uniref:Uncharacterized protein n=1 Tax=Paractinoplanes tereljensis TaxID=571912 RepID=A0A919TWG2_9ACTN|nr:hypothetical protein Ate02nite_55820 [Actinoplanes tereljensis]